ncbi:hypothetical protein [Microbacterium sp. BK668]|uniref:hypothetical protein n=1 Tax=Microbacterium sp. BK668 TaxID=2512118 RepID=UPI001060C403|nr:hypothetical protein [Microbacterium sp. BK668]TDN90898.1 hypothetical protein EV279_0391 [Microbacterium sp. BK668]
MATATADVIGSTPLSFGNASGAQEVVPLSAFEFSGSDIRLKTAWQGGFDAGEQTTLLAVAKARAAVGELTKPPVPPPAAALAVTAAHAGPEGNGITVSVQVEKNAPALEAEITLSAVEVDTWTGLADGDAAAFRIGVDAPTGADGDPPGATGLIAVKKGSTGASAKPAVAKTGVLKKATDVELKDEDDEVVCTIRPRSDYAGKDGLSYEVTKNGATFSITVTYDSTKEAGTQSPVTLLTLGDVADPVAYLVTVGAPPRGAALPADSSAQLSGGAEGLAAGGLLYT